MYRHILAMAAAIGGVASAASAQDTIYWRTPAAVGGAQRAYVPMGTPLVLATRTQVSTKSSKSGERLYLEVAEPLVYRGQTLIPAGSIAVAEVARADRNGYFGDKGKIDIRLLHVETPYGPIRLNGRANGEGRSGLGLSIATIALVSPLGFLIHGTSAKLPFGTVVQGYLGEDLHFTVDPQAQVAAAEPVVQPLPTAFDPRTFAAPRTASR